MIVADKENLYIVSGQGDVIEPDGGVCAIGSGGNYALAAASYFEGTSVLGSSEGPPQLDNTKINVASVMINIAAK